MPWTKIKGTKYYKSPSGKKWTLPMIRAYLYKMHKKYGKNYKKHL